MKLLYRRFFLTLIFCTMLSIVSGDYNRGIEALKNGDYKIAQKNFSSSANEDIPEAMYYLGRMNEEGLGMPKNILAASMWYRKAFENLSRKVSLMGDKARTKACYSNMRVILGAVEMYNMDHTEMMKQLSDSDVIEGGTLVKEGYLKSPIRKPTPGCRYFSVGDLSIDGHIECSKHGRVQ